MKKFLLILLFPILLAACSSRSADIDNLLRELNSPSFRAMQAKTGLFDDTKAEIDGQNFVISFLTRPYINLSLIEQNQYAELSTSCINEFKAHLIDPTFKKGLEAIRDEGLTILMVWQDVNGNKITIPVDPAQILS